MPASPPPPPTPPPAVLRATLQTLCREAPSHLLARELWASAGSAPAWWARSRRLCASAAAGCIVGWLLGLGDRHLDNILLDRSGELMHIDFSVCLDKGAGLRVPEVVPFRLTPMLQVRRGRRQSGRRAARRRLLLMRRR
jgi:PI-3-kinase-related kinase SMG-1